MHRNKETLQLLKAAQSNSSKDILAKLFVQPEDQLTGLMAYDLAPVAAVLYPVMTPLRNRIPRTAGGFNIQANWKVITGINTNNQRAGVSEGNRGGVIEQTTKDYFAAYRTVGLENYVTHEANWASAEFADVKALAVTQLLQATMIREEFLDLGGNTSLELGQTPIPTVYNYGGGGNLPPNTAINIICVALGPQAYLDVAGHNNGSLGQTFDIATAQIPGMITRTNADGSSDTFGGGSAQKSERAPYTTPSYQSIVQAFVKPVRGAWGYAWFVGQTGSERLCAVTATNMALISEIPATSQLASLLPAQDCSTSNLEYDGLWTQAAKPGSNAYWKTLDSGYSLTSDYAGGINEIEEAFVAFYNLYRISPSMMLVSSQECVDMTRIIIGNGGAPLIRWTVDAERVAQGKISAGASIGGYLNKVMGVEVPIIVHPNLPPGTIFFLTESLPYPLPNTAYPFQKKLRAEYAQIDWPPKSRKFEYGIYFSGVLQHFAPFSMGAITNITHQN
jgi:hypothetical protein